MKQYKEIDNTRYIINRVFSSNNTTATLIEQRVKSIRDNLPTVESSVPMMYNGDGGSIQSKEGL